MESGAILLFWWTPHRLAAVDDVDVFCPGFGLLFLAAGNQTHEEDLCVVKDPGEKGTMTTCGICLP